LQQELVAQSIRGACFSKKFSVAKKPQLVTEGLSSTLQQELVAHFSVSAVCDSALRYDASVSISEIDCMKDTNLHNA
jgi:hypothetical protein